MVTSLTFAFAGIAYQIRAAGEEEISIRAIGPAARTRTGLTTAPAFAGVAKDAPTMAAFCEAVLREMPHDPPPSRAS